MCYLSIGWRGGKGAEFSHSRLLQINFKNSPNSGSHTARRGERVILWIHDYSTNYPIAPPPLFLKKNRFNINTYCSKDPFLYSSTRPQPTRPATTLGYQLIKPS